MNRLDLIRYLSEMGGVNPHSLTVTVHPVANKLTVIRRQVAYPIYREGLLPPLIEYSNYISLKMTIPTEMRTVLNMLFLYRQLDRNVDHFAFRLFGEEPWLNVVEFGEEPPHIHKRTVVRLDGTMVVDGFYDWTRSFSPRLAQKRESKVFRRAELWRDPEIMVDSSDREFYQEKVKEYVRSSSA